MATVRAASRPRFSAACRRHRRALQWRREQRAQGRTEPPAPLPAKPTAPDLLALAVGPAMARPMSATAAPTSRHRNFEARYSSLGPVPRVEQIVTRESRHLYLL